MTTRTIAPSKAWIARELGSILRDLQDGLELLHLVIVDSEAGEVVVTSRFSVEKNGNNITFIGTRDSRPKFSGEIF